MKQNLKFDRKSGIPVPSLSCIRQVASTVAVLTLSMAMSATAISDEFIVMNDRVGEIKVFSTVELDNGDSISFTALPDGSGRTAGVLITEKRSPGRRSVHTLPQLYNANALEVYKAVAMPGAREPAILKELYQDTVRDDQGWARGDILSSEGYAGGGTCPSAGNWIADMEQFGNAFNHTPFESIFDGPNTKPEHWQTTSGNGLPGPGEQNRKLSGQANSVTAFYSQILYCVEDYYNNAVYNGNYVGNYVRSYFRPAGHQTWIFSGQNQLENTGESYTHTYSPANRFEVSAPKYDFMVTITEAKPDDEFHIGATWVNGGPSGYTSKY